MKEFIFDMPNAFTWGAKSKGKIPGSSARLGIAVASDKKQAWEIFSKHTLYPRCESIATAKKEGISCTEIETEIPDEHAKFYPYFTRK